MYISLSTYTAGISLTVHMFICCMAKSTTRVTSISLRGFLFVNARW